MPRFAFAAPPLAPPARLQPGYRPVDSDEAGWWDVMSREEEKTRRSRFLMRDPVLNKHVREMVCKLAGDYCPDVRVYIVRTPYFNASMAPNGMMTIWSGALLRAQNDAQLAAVVGHEIGHYLRRHTLELFRDVKDKSALSMFLGFGLAIAGLGALGSVANLLLTASILSFNRDMEREADAIGLDLMAKAGYDPMEASAVWGQLIAERKAREVESARDLVFATHPTEDERERTLADAARGMPNAGNEAAQFRPAYLEAIRAERRMLFTDEIRLRQYGPSLALFKKMLDNEAGDPVLAFAVGEVLRQRNKEGDGAEALAYFDRSLSSPGAPPEAWRSTGLVHQAAGNKKAASDAFRKYLELRPDADDAEMIKSYLEGAPA